MGFYSIQKKFSINQFWMSRSSERDWEKVYREAAARYMKFKEFFYWCDQIFFLVQIKEKFWSRHERRKRKRQKNVVKCLSMKLKLTENMIFRHSDCLFLDAFMTCFFAFFDHEVFIKTREMKRSKIRPYGSSFYWLIISRFYGFFNYKK